MIGPKTEVEKLRAEVAELKSAVKSIAAYIALLPGADKILPRLVGNIATEVRFRTPSFSPVLPGEVEYQTANNIQELAAENRGTPRLSGES